MTIGGSVYFERTRPIRQDLFDAGFKDTRSYIVTGSLQGVETLDLEISLPSEQPALAHYPWTPLGTSHHA